MNDDFEEPKDWRMAILMLLIAIVGFLGTSCDKDGE